MPCLCFHKESNRTARAVPLCRFNGDHHRVVHQKAAMSCAADRQYLCKVLFWVFFVLVLLLSEALHLYVVAEPA